jgi:hypothetical protein
MLPDEINAVDAADRGRRVHVASRNFPNAPAHPVR